jgi:hypothetical protein
MDRHQNFTVIDLDNTSTSHDNNNTNNEFPDLNFNTEKRKTMKLVKRNKNSQTKHGRSVTEPSNNRTLEKGEPEQDQFIRILEKL